MRVAFEMLPRAWNPENLVSATVCCLDHSQTVSIQNILVYRVVPGCDAIHAMSGRSYPGRASSPYLPVKAPVAPLLADAALTGLEEIKQPPIEETSPSYSPGR
jgi:hypothetical protein